MKDLGVHLEEEVQLYPDLLGNRASKNPASTIPDSIIVTAARPNIMLIKDKMVVLLELTTSHNSSDTVHKAKERKR